MSFTWPSVATVFICPRFPINVKRLLRQGCPRWQKWWGEFSCGNPNMGWEPPGWLEETLFSSTNFPFSKNHWTLPSQKTQTDLQNWGSNNGQIRINPKWSGDFWGTFPWSWSKKPPFGVTNRRWTVAELCTVHDDSSDPMRKWWKLEAQFTPRQKVVSDFCRWFGRCVSVFCF